VNEEELEIIIDETPIYEQSHYVGKMGKKHPRSQDALHTYEELQEKKILEEEYGPL